MKYATYDVLDALGISNNRLKEYIRLGFITPSFPAETKGILNYYGVRDVVLIHIVGILAKSGVARNKIHEISPHVHNTVEACPERIVLDYDIIKIEVPVKGIFKLVLKKMHKVGL